jgi:hypothetical protein
MVLTVNVSLLMGNPSRTGIDQDHSRPGNRAGDGRPRPTALRFRGREASFMAAHDMTADDGIVAARSVARMLPRLETSRIRVLQMTRNLTCLF